MPNDTIPLPEPAFGFLVVSEETGQWIGSRAGEAAFDSDNLHAHAAAVSAAKDAEIAGLRAARIAYANEFSLNSDGEPDVGNIHANIRAMKRRVRVLEDAITHYEAALKARWPEGAMGESFEHWNAARDALGDKTPTTPPPSPSPRS